MKGFRLTLSIIAVLAALSAAARTPTGITVSLKLDETNYVVGERIRGVVDVRNMLADRVSVGYSNSTDRCFVEVCRAVDGSELTRLSKHQFVSRFWLKSNEGQKLEVFLGDHFDLSEPARYLARPVLVHGGYRYEGQSRSFDIVPGMSISSAVQMFKNSDGQSRQFDLVHWARRGTEHLFVMARDTGGGNRRWLTTDVGPMMRMTPPTVSILPSGEVIVFHRNGADSFVRSEFWSMRDALVLRSRQMVRDPETAGQQKVQEIYNKRGGVKPVERPWWKFW